MALIWRAHTCARRGSADRSRSPLASWLRISGRPRRRLGCPHCASRRSSERRSRRRARSHRATDKRRNIHRVITWRRDPAGGETRLWSVTAELFFPHVRVTPGGSAWPPLAARGGRRERARRRAGAMVDGRCYRARRWLKSCSGAGSVCGSLDASSMAADRRIPQRHRPAARGRLRSTCGSYCSPETGHPAESGDWNWSGISTAARGRQPRLPIAADSRRRKAGLLPRRAAYGRGRERTLSAQAVGRGTAGERRLFPIAEVRSIRCRQPDRPPRCGAEKAVTVGNSYSPQTRPRLQSTLRDPL